MYIFQSFLGKKSVRNEPFLEAIYFMDFLSPPNFAQLSLISYSLNNTDHTIESKQLAIIRIVLQGLIHDLYVPTVD